MGPSPKNRGRSTPNSSTPTKPSPNSPTGGSPSTKKKRYNAFVLSKQKYSVGDGVLIQANVLGHPPYIGEIVKIEAEPKDNKNVVLTLKWFYRPEEIEGGRRKYHGQHELLKSEHADECHVGTVNGPAKILTFDEYIQLDSESGGNVPEDTYFCRQTYDAKKKEIKTKLSLFCLCREPQNPDKMMIQCDACDEWYHDECVHLTQKEKDAPTWICPKCRQNGIQCIPDTDAK